MIPIMLKDVSLPHTFLEVSAIRYRSPRVFGVETFGLFTVGRTISMRYQL